MVSRRPMLCSVAIATMALWLLHDTLMPAFAGVRPAASGRASHVARHAVARLEVYRETSLDDVKKEARTLLGFTQDFLDDKDWHMYYAEDESVELKGKMGDYPDYYKPWAPDGFEIHMKYEPNKK